jgi:hypothetical protein
MVAAMLDSKIRATSILPEGFEQFGHEIQNITVIDPFKPNFLYMSPMVVITLFLLWTWLGRVLTPRKNQMLKKRHYDFNVPCMLPTWLESRLIPCGTSAPAYVNT